MCTIGINEFTDHEFLSKTIFNQVDCFSFSWFKIQKVILIFISGVFLQFLNQKLVLSILFWVKESFEIIVALDFLLIIYLFIDIIRKESWHDVIIDFYHIQFITDIHLGVLS